MYLSGSQNIQKSMNGLLRIRATEIDCDTAIINEIDGIQTINGKVGENIVITPDTGIINLNGDVEITGTLDVSGNSVFDDDVSINNAVLNLTGEMTIYDRVDTTRNMTAYYDAPDAGFRFLNNTRNGYIYFSVLNGAGTRKSFQFNHSQVYSNIGFYCDNWLNISSNNDLTFGDNNGSIWVGSRAKFIPSSNPQDGFVFYVKGFNNNTAYYTNFTHNNLSNVETSTLRMNYANIWSKVKHIFETDMDVTGTATMNGALNVNGTANLNTTYFNGIVSAYTFVNFYQDIYLYSTAKLYVNGMTGITQNELSRLSGVTSNIQTQLNGKLNLTGGTITGSLNISNALDVGGITNLSTTYFNGNLNALFTVNIYNDLYLLTGSKLFVNGTTGITQNELSYLSGTTSNIQTQLNGKLNLSGGTMTGALVVNNTITTNNNITQTGTTATTNRIIQPIVVGDLTGNHNVFKYSKFVYNNSGNTTASAVLSCIEETSSNSMLFFPKLGSGSYNPIVKPDDRGIFSFWPFNTGAITLTCWADTRVGVRVATPSSTTSLVDIWAKNCNLKVDSSNNVLISANNSTSSTPDLRILNTGSARGIQFISNTTLSASNTFVGASEALITTQTQNNSSLVLTTSNSALNYGIRILSNSSTTATITTKVANNSIVMNQTDTTVNGPISFQGTSTFSTGTSFPFGFDVGNGNIALNRTDATLFNYITSNENLVLQSKKIYLTTSSAQSIDHWSDNHYFRDNTGTGACNVYVNGNISLTSNVIFNDATQQQTAYTNALNTKLNAIGTLLTSSLSATTTLTNNTIFNCGSISLTTGTWILSINCCVAVITGTTTVSELLAGYSTSSTSLSQSTNLSINNWNGTTLMSVGSQCCLTSTNTVVVASTTTYYMLTRVLFGTASRMQFVQGNSSFTATRIA